MVYKFQPSPHTVDMTRWDGYKTWGYLAVVSLWLHRQADGTG